MIKVTILCTPEKTGTVTVEGDTYTAEVPVGVELAVSDDFAAACIADHTCLVGYYVADTIAVAALPTTGIADGSYCMVMSTQTLKFLSGGAWV